MRRIQQDESRYLLPQEGAEEKPEEAVVDELSRLDLIPIKIDPSLQDNVEADLANTKYDIPITLNEEVLKALDFWLSRGRKIFHEGLMRSGRYTDMIVRDLPRGVRPAGPDVPGAGGKPLQDQRAVPGQGQGDLAVRQVDGDPLWTQGQQLHR